MKNWSSTFVALALMLAAQIAAAQGALDGKKYLGDIGDKGKAAEDTSVVFTFADGKFQSSVCEKYGFEKGAYTTAKEGDAVRFEATALSPEYGRNQWRGTVKGNEVEGVLVWQRKPSFFRPNPEPVERWFKAKLM
jgi:hypothetical protein